MPPSLRPCAWVFALKGVGQSDSAQASLKIALVLSSDYKTARKVRWNACTAFS